MTVDCLSHSCCRRRIRMPETSSYSSTIFVSCCFHPLFPCAANNLNHAPTRYIAPSLVLQEPTDELSQGDGTNRRDHSISRPRQRLRSSDRLPQASTLRGGRKSSEHVHRSGPEDRRKRLLAKSRTSVVRRNHYTPWSLHALTNTSRVRRDPENLQRTHLGSGRPAELPSRSPGKQSREHSFRICEQLGSALAKR